jgi:hypothetical protein
LHGVEDRGVEIDWGGTGIDVGGVRGVDSHGLEDAAGGDDFSGVGAVE